MPAHVAGPRLPAPGNLYFRKLLEVSGGGPRPARAAATKTQRAALAPTRRRPPMQRHARGGPRRGAAAAPPGVRDELEARVDGQRTARVHWAGDWTAECSSREGGR